MKTNRERMLRAAILEATHYGVGLYAHVLHQYYPQEETVLILRKKKCLPARNPFNGDRETLQISIVGGEARHRDAEVEACKGDAFDFAARHYQLKGEALLEKVGEELGLGLGMGKRQGGDDGKSLIPSLPSQGKIEGNGVPVFSFFKKPVTNTLPSGCVSLVEVHGMIKGTGYQKRTNALRAIGEEKEARAYKASQFDYVTFSGVFERREHSALVQHSGLFVVDFDHLEDVEGLRQRLLGDAYFETALLFVSPSGRGLKWVIPIDLSRASHQEWGKGLGNYLLKTYQQKMDVSGKDVARACFLPHDPNVYINPKHI